MNRIHGDDMKKFFWIFMVLVLLFTLSACEKKPAKVARGFLEAMHNHDYETAKELTVESGHEILDMLASFSEGINEEDRRDSDTDFRIIKTVVRGDSAFVTYETWSKSEPDSVSTVEMPLVKENGDWKVDFSKDDLDK